MPYRLSMTRRPGEELRRCADEELASAVDGLRAASADAAERAAAVHSARKHVKKARSLIRLARPVIGARHARAANDALREAGGTLSGARDAHVLGEVIEDLRERGVGRVPAVAFDQLRDALVRPAAGAGSAAAGDPLAAAADQLTAVRGQIAGWRVKGARWRTLADGLTRTYARGRAELAELPEHPDVETRHDWRKRVKDLWYQQRLLEGAWPVVLEAQAEEAHALSELLGDDHDLAVLQEAIAGAGAAAGPDADGIVELVEHRRAELLEAALLLGRRVYAEKPKAYRKRMRAYVEVWAAAEQRSPVEV
jgi:CHAD domain-containing protein